MLFLFSHTRGKGESSKTPLLPHVWRPRRGYAYQRASRSHHSGHGVFRVSAANPSMVNLAKASPSPRSLALLRHCCPLVSVGGREKPRLPALLFLGRPRYPVSDRRVRPDQELVLFPFCRSGRILTVDFVFAVCCERLLAKARRQEDVSRSLGGLAVSLLFWIKFEIATLRVADLSSPGHNSWAKDRWPLQYDGAKSKMAFVPAVDFRGQLYPISIHRGSLGASFANTNSKECKREFCFHQSLRCSDGVHLRRLFICKFQELWEKPASRLPLQLWGHRAFLLARGPVHGDGLR